MINFFWNRVRRYGRSKQYKLGYKPKPKSLQVWYCGALMESKIDYRFNKKLNSVIFSFMPQIGAIVEVEGMVK